MASGAVPLSDAVQRQMQQQDVRDLHEYAEEALEQEKRKLEVSIADAILDSLMGEVVDSAL